MTNKEKFIEVFGEEPQRQYATKSWWEQEYVPPITINLEIFEPQESEDCRKCKKWEDCPCGKEGHESGTSQGYSIGECKDFEPQERSE